MKNETDSFTKHGVFISYKRQHKHLAGRIYDFFMHKGFSPFMDEYDILVTNDYWNIIFSEIKNAPYYFCILTSDYLEDLLSDDYKDKSVYKEVKAAVDSNRDFIILRDKDTNYRMFDKLPAPIRETMKTAQSLEIPDNNAVFSKTLNDIYAEMNKKLKTILDWREYWTHYNNVHLLERKRLHSTVASLENRFGAEFIQCVRSRTDYQGPYIIKEIDIACYAGNIIFTPKLPMVDFLAFDAGIMARIFIVNVKIDFT